MPVPGYVSPAEFDSPVPTQTTFGSRGSRPMSPMLSDGWLSKIGWNVAPASVERKMPPDAVAT
jgi:hypothetical protein